MDSVNAVLLQSRLVRPAPRATLVPRPRLIDSLNAGLPGKLTVISAPPGFGKTTLLADWLEALAQGEPAAAAAWLALDGLDPSPPLFLAYLAAALQAACPGVGEAVAALLDAPQPPALDVGLALLGNELGDQPGRVVLVLDDYHTVSDRDVQGALAGWAEHLPPNLHLVLAARADPPLPLARLRARGELNELHAAELRFSLDEAAAFFQQVSGLALSPANLAALEQRTEGWVAGLQLAALSMQGRQDIPAFIQAFAGSHAHVLDYLAEEVLRQQPPEVRSFLQETAILERLCAPLCAAVTGTADCQPLLEQLLHNNLFIQPLDDRREWFRYHSLFRDVLHMQLTAASAERQPELHRRASRWFEENNLPEEAIRHALAGGDPERAVELVERAGMELLERGETLRLRAWLDLLPPELVAKRPPLALLHGAVLAATGQIEAAQRWLDESVQAPELQGELASQRAMLKRFQGDPLSAIAFSRQALDLLPAEEPGARSRALANLLMAQLQLGDLEAVEHTLQQLQALGEHGQEATLLGARLGVAWLLARRGRLAEAAGRYRQVLAEAQSVYPRPFVALGMTHTGLGEILYAQNDLPGAVEHLEAGISLLRRSIEQILLAYAAGALAQAQQALGDPVAALDTLAEAAAWLESLQLADLGFGSTLAAHRALLHLQRGDHAVAVLWADTCQLPETIIYPREREYLVLARVRLLQGRPAEAGAILEPLEQAYRLRQWHGDLVEVLALQARALAEQRDLERALAVLEESLALAEPQGAARVFLDEGEPMLRLLWQVRERGKFRDWISALIAAARGDEETAGASPAAGELPDPLSERELEVLRLAAAGASNQAIADTLYVSLPTVKKHMGNIMVKLDVTSRTQAAARARQLGLL